MLPEARVQGFATDVSIAAIAFGYDDLGWSIVEAPMNDDDLAAKPQVQRLGRAIILRETFPDGITRDLYELPRDGTAKY